MAVPKGHIPYAGCEKGGDLGGRPEKYTQQKIEQEADAFLEWMTRPESIWYKDFALERGYSAEFSPSGLSPTKGFLKFMRGLRNDSSRSLLKAVF